MVLPSDESTMMRLRRKIRGKLRRKKHIRKKVFGTPEKPRLTVFRSHRNIYCQLIDDSRGVTIASGSSQIKDLQETLGKWGGNQASAAVVGKFIAERAMALGISTVAFDRNGYRFHGRVKALAEAAREAGLKF